MASANPTVAVAVRQLMPPSLLSSFVGISLLSNRSA
jgi:hypothetical protein